MEIKIISRESIRPSSPTPPHLRNYKLSMLDQYMPATYVPMVLFYPTDTDHHLASHKTQLLKQSLSESLTRFYPLAGKIKDHLTIDCNDEGAYFAEARILKARMSDFLKQPHLPLIQWFLPYKADCDEPTTGSNVAMFQVNVFDCGGIAIGAFVSHMAADGTAVSTFLKSWAATAYGSCGTKFPSYISDSLFLQNYPMPRETVATILSPFFKTGKGVTRRFTFNSSAISVLKARATSLCGRIPTRVQAVSALIWKCFIATRREKSGTQKLSLVHHSINLRRRASPPVSESCMGNYLWLAVAQCQA